MLPLPPLLISVINLCRKTAATTAGFWGRWGWSWEVEEVVWWIGGWWPEEVVFCIHLLIAGALIYVATVSDGQRRRWRCRWKWVWNRSRCRCWNGRSHSHIGLMHSAPCNMQQLLPPGHWCAYAAPSATINKLNGDLM